MAAAGKRLEETMSETKSVEVVDVDLSQPAAEGMVRVTFLPQGKTVEFPFDTLPYEGHGEPMSFLDVAENYDIFLDHACGGVCACTTCHIHVKEGAAGLSEPEDKELDRMWWRFRSGTGTMCRTASRRMGRGASPFLFPWG